MLWKITDTLIVYYILCLCVRLWGYLSLLSAYVQRAGLSGYATELWIYRCEYSSLSNSTVYAHASVTAFRRHHEKFIHFHFYISPPLISSAPNWPQVMERVITFVDMLMFWSEESYQPTIGIYLNSKHSSSPHLISTHRHVVEMGNNIKLFWSAFILATILHRWTFSFEFSQTLLCMYNVCLHVGTYMLYSKTKQQRVAHTFLNDAEKCNSFQFNINLMKNFNSNCNFYGNANGNY